MCLNGFCQRMYELGFKKSQIEIIETYNDYQTTYRKVSESLKQISQLSAIYIANRSVAGCTEAVSAAGKKELYILYAMIYPRSPNDCFKTAV